jgi:hypothetical protein
MYIQSHISKRADCIRLINAIHLDCTQTHTIITSEVFALGYFAMKMLYQAVSDIYETRRTHPYCIITATRIIPGGQVIIAYDYFDFAWRRITTSVHSSTPNYRVVTIMLPEEYA